VIPFWPFLAFSSTRYRCLFSVLSEEPHRPIFYGTRARGHGYHIAVLDNSILNFETNNRVPVETFAAFAAHGAHCFFYEAVIRVPAQGLSSRCYFLDFARPPLRVWFHAPRFGIFSLERVAGLLIGSFCCDPVGTTSVRLPATGVALGAIGAAWFFAIFTFLLVKSPDLLDFFDLCYNFRLWFLGCQAPALFSASKSKFSRRFIAEKSP